MAFGLPILQRLMQDKEEEKWYEDYPDEEKRGRKETLASVDRDADERVSVTSGKNVSRCEHIHRYPNSGDCRRYGKAETRENIEKTTRDYRHDAKHCGVNPRRLETFDELRAVDVLTLDEADRMVERGHFKELENVIKSIPEPPETRRIARSAKLTKRKQPMMTMSKKVTMNGGKEKKNEKEQEEEQEEEEENEEPTTTDNRRIWRETVRRLCFPRRLPFRMKSNTNSIGRNRNRRRRKSTEKYRKMATTTTTTTKTMKTRIA